jgi:hypothetical protein
VEDLVLWLKIAVTKWQFVRSPQRLFQWRENGLNQSTNELKMLRAELAAVSLLQRRVRCDPKEMVRIQQAARIEYAKNLVVDRRWQEAAQVLKECSPALAQRWLSLSVATKASCLAHTKLVQLLHCSDAHYESETCSGECALEGALRTACMATCHQPYFRPQTNARQKEG